MKKQLPDPNDAYNLTDNGIFKVSVDKATDEVDAMGATTGTSADFESVDSAIEVSVGVDWATCTEKRADDYERFYMSSREIQKRVHEIVVLVSANADEKTNFFTGSSFDKT